MPRLTRQRTPQSLYSEWSQSYLGATISIHALAKPLMKPMYHRAVLNLIKQQQGIPLTAETMQIYESYLMFKYVADITKALILRKLEERARVEAEAHLVTDFLVLYDILLDAPDEDIRTNACWVLGQLAFHPSTRPAVVAVQPGARLVALLSDANVNVVKAACFAVSHICLDFEGATAVVETGAPRFLKQLLESQDEDIRTNACWVLGQLAFHPSTRPAVVAVQPGARLVALLSDANVNVVKAACFAVSHICLDVEGATAVVETGAPRFLKELLESQDEDVRRHACWALGQLAFHSSTRAAVVAVNPGAHLVALLNDGNVNIVRGASYAVSYICYDLDGATAVVETGAPRFLKELLESPDEGLPENPDCDGDVRVVDGACFALANLAPSRTAARALTEAGALDLVAGLIESPQVEVLFVTQYWATLALLPSGQPMQCFLYQYFDA
ncbi:armadillo-type protein [Mycena metata]|uniref:Armadillo-type protein n=1 Tax=Mycena metata TaxID=1033252 RepID=A0AAD7J7A4_9AGAR|nr:armadillo-type protein [Mycena metata]